MKLELDPQARSLYIYLTDDAEREGLVDQSIRVNPQCVLDLSSDGALVGIELLCIDIDGLEHLKKVVA